MPLQLHKEQEKSQGPARKYTDVSRPFKLVKFLSWSSLLLIVATGLFVSVVIANSARQTLLTKQQEFALLLAENLNHQIFQRFTLPTILRFRRIELKNKDQYSQLDSVIQSTIHGLHVLDLRIYDDEFVTAYSINEESIGRTDLAGTAAKSALADGKHSFEIVSGVSPLTGMFRLKLPPGTVIIRTTYPLRTERRIFPGDTAGQVMGILEFTQDITDDYTKVINFQWLIITTAFFSSLLLFLILTFFIRMADKIITMRAEEKEKLERELHQSEKLAGMGRVVAGIAHEIRNPLGIIQSSAELLMKKAKAEESSEVRILSAMHDEIKRLGRTVNDFLDYARPKNPEKTKLDLSELLDQALVFMEEEMKARNIQVVRQYAPGIFVRGDRDLLYRAVYNILANAVQALDDGGVIRISGYGEVGGVLLTVTDNGPGFPKEALGKLADPFFTTKDNGTGLGLAIVSTILDGHGGDISFTNEPDGGARVEMFIPGN